MSSFIEPLSKQNFRQHTKTASQIIRSVLKRKSKRMQSQENLTTIIYFLWNQISHDDVFYIKYVLRVPVICRVHCARNVYGCAKNLTR